MGTDAEKPIVMAIRLTGHKTPLIFHRYNHQNGERIQAAMEKLENHYLGTKGANYTPITHVPKKARTAKN